jgi:hypothetical protein
MKPLRGILSNASFTADRGKGLRHGADERGKSEVCV